MECCFLKAIMAWVVIIQNVEVIFSEDMEDTFVLGCL